MMGSILKPIEPLETPAGYDVNYMYLEDMDSLVDPEPVTAIVDPEPNQEKVVLVFDSSEKTPQCGQGTKLVNNICQITATQIDTSEENSKKQTGMFENFIK